MTFSGQQPRRIAECRFVGQGHLVELGRRRLFWTRYLNGIVYQSRKVADEQRVKEKMMMMMVIDPHRKSQ